MEIKDTVGQFGRVFQNKYSSLWDLEVQGSEVQTHTQLQTKSDTILGYSLKTNKNQGNLSYFLNHPKPTCKTVSYS